MAIPRGKNWVLFGSSGLLGSDLAKELNKRNEPIFCPTRKDFSIYSGLDRLTSLIENASTVVNCVAYTNVDLAESESELAFATNHQWPQKLAEVCRKTESQLIHISTDYVFAGDKKEPYLPADETRPINAYGASKLAGEEAVFNSGAEFSIFRTAWLYGEGGPCFPRSICSKLERGESLSVVTDQFGSPTWTRDLAQHMIRHVDLNYLPPIVHATSSGVCSWYEFAVEIANSLQYDSRLIKRIESDAYNTAAIRPKFSVLKCENDSFGVIGDWRERWRAASKLFG